MYKASEQVPVSLTGHRRLCCRPRCHVRSTTYPTGAWLAFSLRPFAALAAGALGSLLGPRSAVGKPSAASRPGSENLAQAYSLSPRMRARRCAVGGE